VSRPRSVLAVAAGLVVLAGCGRSVEDKVSDKLGAKVQGCFENPATGVIKDADVVWSCDTVKGKHAVMAYEVDGEIVSAEEVIR
jgi:hypothetical protein